MALCAILLISLVVVTEDVTSDLRIISEPQLSSTQKKRKETNGSFVEKCVSK